MLLASLSFNLVSTALVLPQLEIEPSRIAVGQTVEVRAMRHDRALADAPIELVLPDGSESTIGTTGADGRLTFVPAAAGEHVLRTEAEGVVMLAPLHVLPARPRWLVAAVCVPLGLALLWRNLSRARGRRAS